MSLSAEKKAPGVSPEVALSHLFELKRAIAPSRVPLILSASRMFLSRSSVSTAKRFHRAAAVHGSSVTIDTAALGFGDEVDAGSRGVVDDLLGRFIGLFVLAAVKERPCLEQFHGVIVQLVLAVGGEHQRMVTLVRADGIVVLHDLGGMGQIGVYLVQNLVGRR